MRVKGFSLLTGILNRLKLIPRGRSRKDAFYIAGSPPVILGNLLLNGAPVVLYNADFNCDEDISNDALTIIMMMMMVR